MNHFILNLLFRVCIAWRDHLLTRFMICALKDFEQGCIRSIEELLKLHFQSLKTAFDPQKHIF